MSNDIIGFDAANVVNIDGLFEGASDDDLKTGSSGGFPVMSIKSSRWGVKPSGADLQPLMNENDEPQQSIEAVIIDSQKGVSKSYYTKAYGDGDAGAPDCYSVTGVEPAGDVENPISSKCASCPMAQWGSYITPAGKKAKACKDVKRLAVTFASNIDNEELGGPMLLRVPGASHKDMDRFAAGMKAKGFQMQQIAVRIGFDLHSSYPKLTFKPIRPLTKEEILAVSEHFHSEQVRDILAGQQHSTKVGALPAPAKQDSVSLDFEQPAVAAPIPQPVVAQPVVAKPVVSEPVAVEPAAPAKTSSSVENDLDAIMGDLSGL